MSYNKPPKISFTYGNMLRVNNKHLWADVLPAPDAAHEVVGPGRLAAYLEVGRQAIAAVHQAMPEVFAAHLSTEQDTYGRETNRILTPEGWDKWTGIHDDPNMLTGRFGPYWDVVASAGYRPRARLASSPYDGVWLMLQRQD